MKKFVLMFSVLFTMSASVFAEDLTVTLQQGDVMTPFYGVDAFKKAYEAAPATGAIITLSAGTFNPVESIEKSMKIMGYDAFGSTYSNTKIESAKILADNVTIEGVFFTGNVELGNISNCHIKRCYLSNRLTATETHTNTFIDQSFVQYDYAIGSGVNYVIKNSTLTAFCSKNTISNKAKITNCVIWKWCSSYSGDSNIKQPYAIYMNNILGGYNRSAAISYKCDAVSEYYYNYYVRSYGSSYGYSVSYPTDCINEGNSTYSSYENVSSSPCTKAWNKTGMDGTVVGILGGTGFSALPSIPRITSSTIDSHTDSQGKFNVKISATIGSNF